VVDAASGRHGVVSASGEEKPIRASEVRIMMTAQ
jgi:hypothetical protein